MYVYLCNFQVIFKHDTGRVIQACVKFGTEQQRQKLFEQFKGKLSGHCINMLFLIINFNL